MIFHAWNFFCYFPGFPWFKDQLSLNAGQKYCRMLQREHSAILSTFIKLPFVIKIFILSIFVIHRFYCSSNLSADFNVGTFVVVLIFNSMNTCLQRQIAIFNFRSEKTSIKFTCNISMGESSTKKSLTFKIPS